MLLHKSTVLFALIFSLVFCICHTTRGGVAKNNFVKICTDTLPNNCVKNDDIEKIIADAISLGAPVYNEGLHMACYRIYEWASYKILYEYGTSCKDVQAILKDAIDKSHGDYSDTEKAWLMRAAFDKILGVPTRTVEPENSTSPSKG